MLLLGCQAGNRARSTPLLYFVRPLTRTRLQVQESTSLLDALSDVFHESLLVMLAPKSLVMLSMVSRKGRELVDDCPKNISTSLW